MDAAKGMVQMIRLTLILLVAIGVTLSVAGRDLPDQAASAPQAAPGAAAAAQVTKSRADLSGTGPTLLALDDEDGAIARALAGDGSAPAPGGQARLWSAATGEAVSASAAAAPPEAIAAAPRAMARVNATRVNLRAGPSTANEVLDQVTLDQRVEVLEAGSDGWSRIRVPESGRVAWIFDRFLTPGG